MSRRSVLNLLVAAGAITAASIGSAHAAPPPNDACSNAVVLPLNSPVNGTTAEATVSFTVELENCSATDPEVWYVFTPPAVGVYRFSATGTDNSTLSLSVISNCGFPYSLDGCDYGSGSEGPYVDVSKLFETQPLRIRVGSSVAQSFTVTATVTPPPVNDECGGAIALSQDVPYTGNSATATTSVVIDDANACSSIVEGFTTGADVFFKFTPGSTGFFDISACGTEFDSVLSVHSGCPATAANMIQCNDNGSMVGCGSFETFSAYITGVPMTGGVTYYIRLAGSRQFDFTGRGNYSITVLEGAETPVPANDLCINPEVITADSFFAGSTVNSTIGTPSSCGFDDVFDVWYSFTSPSASTTNYKFRILGSSFGGQASMSVYDTCSTEVSCVSFGPFTVPMSAGYTIGLEPNETVLIRIAGNGASQDSFVLETQTAGAAGPGTACDMPIQLVAGVTANVDTTNASTHFASSCSGFPDVYPKWYTFTSTTPGYYRFAADNVPNNGVTIAIFDECGGTERTCAIRGDGLSAEPLDTAVSLQLGANETVLVRTAIDASGQGQYTLTANGPLPNPPAVTNDTCGTAETIPAMPFNDTTNITLAGDDQSICVSPPSTTQTAYSGIWYTFTATSNTYLLASATCSDETRNARTTVFTGACGSLTQVVCQNIFSPSGGAPIALTAGTTYRLLVSLGESRNGGDPPVPYGTTITVNFQTMNPPANDLCANAQAITSGTATINFTNILATADTASASCSFGTSRNNGVWFKFTTGTTGTLTLHGEHPFGSGGSPTYSPMGTLYSGACGSFTEVACDNPVDMLLTNHFDITTNLTASTTYYILVSSYGFGGGGGDTQLVFSYTGTIVAPCAADFNNVNGVTVQDIFDFLTAWLAGSPTANFNGVNGVTVQDIFDFLTAWLAGC